MNVTLIEHVIRHRLFVLAGVLAAIVLSAYAIFTAPLDAIPDISDPQVVLYAKWTRSPQLLESQITEPVIKSLAGIPGIQSIRATSHMGYSFIYVILEREAQRAAIRNIVTDRLNAIRPQLPADATVTLGPNASSMGWIYQYALVGTDGSLDLRELRLLHEQLVKPGLQGVPGVAEVASVGGLEKQYQLKIFPPLMAESGLSLKQIEATLQNAFPEAGGRTLEVSNRDYQIRGIVTYDNVDQLELMVVGHRPSGAPIHLKDIGYIQVGYDQRRGVAELDGKGEAVGGIVVMEQKRNVLEVTHALDRKLTEIKAGLPPGVDLVTTYDRSALIRGTLEHFLTTLAYELLVVIAVMILFLRNARTAVAPVLILLLGVAFTAIPLAAFHQTINLFSLAGLFIAIGEMVDATIVMVENCTAELAARRRSAGIVEARERRAIIVRSIAHVARPLLFSLLIILVSFLPVFFLTEKEGRLFDPLAYSKTFAMAFSTLLTMFLLPILIQWIFKKEAPTDALRAPGDSALARAYRHAVTKAIDHRYVFLGGSLAAVAGAILLLSHFRTDFMPRMDEGTVLYMPTTLPGVPVREAAWILQQMDRKLAAFPEVKRVFGKLGRADTATDPAPVSMIETTILLKPKAEWRDGMSKEKLVADMDAAMKITGYVNSWVQPISARVAMQDTGIQTAVGLKVKGGDIATLESLSQQIEELLRTLPESPSVIAERISSGYFIDTRFDPVRMARLGIRADEAMLTARYAIGGDNAVAFKDHNNLTIPLSIQYAPEYIDTLEKIRNAPVVTSDRHPVALSEIAEVSVRKMPEMLRSENGLLTSYVYVDIGDASATDYVRKAQGLLAGKLDLPTGYAVEWTGEHQNVARSHDRLTWIVPATLLIMLALLVMAFRSLTDSLVIMLSAPFAFVGAVALQWALGYSMTTAVIIGYIALFAVAIQTGIIMIVFIRQALTRRSEGTSYMEAVVEGSVARLRPKLMTVACATLSLLPVMFLGGPGSEIMKPIATPTVGGMVSSTIYVLFLIPCLFAVGQDIAAFRQRHALARLTGWRPFKRASKAD